MNKFFYRVITLGSLLLLPAVAMAQVQSGLGDIGQSFGIISLFLNQVVIPFIFAIALVVFIWGAFRYFVLGGDDPEKRKEGSKLMIYGIVGFVLMISVFGIVNLIANGLGLTDETVTSMPDISTINE